MKIFFKWFGIFIGGVLLLLLLVFFGLYIHWKTLAAQPITGDDGKNIKGSISVMEQITLGGIRQTIYIRGYDQTKPVILFLHGGPGSPESVMIKHYNASLEKNFIVVNWDQRGSGKSYSPFIPENTMNANQFVSDTIELAEYLRNRFKQGKIYLVGHSWGSVLGIYAIRKHPEMFRAYIGVGQVVNLSENERLSYKFTLDEAHRRGDAYALKKLESIKEYYIISNYKLSKLMKQRDILMKYGGALYGRNNYDLLFKADLKGEYSIFDMVTFLLGSYKSISQMWPELMQNVKLEKTDTEFKIPVYFFTGSHDYNVPFELTEKYFQIIKAPRKGIVWFDKSAHMPNFEEPDKFMTELNKVFR